MSKDGKVSFGIAEALRELLGPEQVISPEQAAERASSYWDPSPMHVAALVRPRTTDELSRVLRLCHERSQTVVTHGGLTGCVEGATTTARDVVISLERMTAIEEMDLIGRTATVQGASRCSA